MIYKIESRSYVDAPTEAEAVTKFWDKFMTLEGLENTSIDLVLEHQPEEEEIVNE